MDRLRIIAFVLMGASIPALAQDRTYVLVSSIGGESTDPSHLNWIDAYALDTQVLKTGGSATQFPDIAFLKGTDRATPLLHDAVSKGTNFPTANIEVCRPAATGQQCYYRINLSTVIVTAVDLAGSSCVGPGACTPTMTESIKLDYTRIEWIYTPYTGGVPGTPVKRCWDIPSNTAC